MRIGLSISSFIVIAFLSAQTAYAAEAPEGRGKELFEKYCAICHQSGGNILKPNKTLHGSDLAANGITTAQDIVKFMRNPKSQMTKFDKETIPDKEALEIAEFIIKTFW
jgi:cytochrome c6